MMSIINENRVRSRSKPISWPSCALVGLGFLPFWRGCCSGCGCWTVLEWVDLLLLPFLLELLKTGSLPFPF